MEKLNVPMRISLQWELWQGFGKKELLQTVCVTVAGSLFLFLLCLLLQVEGKLLVMVFGVIFILAMASGFFTRMDGNQSMYDYLQRIEKYHATQQKFLFIREER